MSQAPASLAADVVHEATASVPLSVVRGDPAPWDADPSPIQARSDPPTIVDRAKWIARALEQFEGPLLRYATRLTGDADQACDVVQETFMRLLEQDRARLAGSEAAWLYTVCRHRAMDIHRRRRAMRGESNMGSVLSASDVRDGHDSAEAYGDPRDLRAGAGPSARKGLEQAADPAEQASLAESADRVRKALAQLPQRQQEVVSLRFQAELSYKQIAEVTGLSVTNVGFLIHTAVATLRKRLSVER